MVQHDKAEFMLCTLEYGRVYQQTLDLYFTEDEEVTFFLNSEGTFPVFSRLRFWTVFTHGGIFISHKFEWEI